MGEKPSRGPDAKAAQELKNTAAMIKERATASQKLVGTPEAILPPLPPENTGGKGFSEFLELPAEEQKRRYKEIIEGEKAQEISPQLSPKPDVGPIPQEVLDADRLSSGEPVRKDFPESNRTEEIEQQTKETLEARKDFVETFLLSYQIGNEDELNNNLEGKERIKKAMTLFKNPDLSKRDINPALEIVKEMIGDRIKILENPESFASLAEADKRIIAYTTDTVDIAIEKIKKNVEILDSDEIAVLEKYLTVYDKKVKTEDEREKLNEIMKKLGEIKEEMTIMPPKFRDGVRTVVDITPETLAKAKEHVSGVNEGGSESQSGENPDKVTVPMTPEKPKVEEEPNREDTVTVSADETQTVPVTPEISEVATPQELSLREKAEAWFLEAVEKGEIETETQFKASREKEFFYGMWQEKLNEACSKLSSKEQKRFNDLKSNRRILDPLEVDGLFLAGLDLDQLEDIRHGFLSSKIKSKNLTSGKLVSEKEFDDLVKEKIEKKKNEVKAEAEKKIEALYEERRKAAIEAFIMKFEEQEKAVAKKVALDKLAKEAAEKIAAEKLAAENAEAEKIARERVEKAAAKRAIIAKRVVAARKIPSEKRLELLNELRYNWKSAEKIDGAIKSGRKIKIESGEVLDPKTQKSEVEKMREVLSDDIIKTAEKLTGKNLKQVAMKRTGYNPKNFNEKKQKNFREYLTREVENIFKKQIERAKIAKEKATDKKVKVVLKKK